MLYAYIINSFMKQALILGGGSKWGASLTKTLSQQGYFIDLITSNGIIDANIQNHKVDWNTITISDCDHIIDNLDDKKYDIIFFNQNSGGGPNDIAYVPGGMNFPIEHWNRANWINSQITYYFIRRLANKIGTHTKIGWMLTGLIDGKDPEMWKYAGYASVKSTNVHIMRGFAKYHHGIFFAIQPSWFPEEDFEKDANSILNTIQGLSIKDTGSIFTKEGENWSL